MHDQARIHANSLSTYLHVPVSLWYSYSNWLSVPMFSSDSARCFEFELITGQAAMADLSRGTAQVNNYKKIINND